MACENGHVFIFSSENSTDHVPEGFACACGSVTAHWEKCPCCGQLQLVERPTKEGEPGWKRSGLRSGCGA